MTEQHLLKDPRQGVAGEEGERPEGASPHPHPQTIRDHASELGFPLSKGGGWQGVKRKGLQTGVKWVGEAF